MEVDLSSLLFCVFATGKALKMVRGLDQDNGTVRATLERLIRLLGNLVFLQMR